MTEYKNQATGAVIGGKELFGYFKSGAWDGTQRDSGAWDVTTGDGDTIVFKPL